jgi:hypothetical protein
MPEYKGRFLEIKTGASKNGNKNWVQLRAYDGSMRICAPFVPDHLVEQLNSLGLKFGDNIIIDCDVWAGKNGLKQRLKEVKKV